MKGLIAMPEGPTIADGSLAVAALTDDAASAERYFELLDDIYAELHRKGSAAWIPDGLRHRLYAAIREREARK